MNYRFDRLAFLVAFASTLALSTSASAMSNTESWGDLAQGKFYRYSTPPSSSYQDVYKYFEDSQQTIAVSDGSLLTDEQAGTAWPLAADPNVDPSQTTGAWVGWWQRPVSITVDLGKVYSASQFVIRAASRTDWGMYFPASVTVEVSNDNAHWATVGTGAFPASTFNFSTAVAGVNNTWASGRWVRFTFPNNGAWLMLDELWVRGSRADSRKLVPPKGAYHGAFAAAPCVASDPTSDECEAKSSIHAFEYLVSTSSAPAAPTHPLKMVLWYNDWTDAYGASSGAKGFQNTYLDGRLLELGWLPSNTTAAQISRGSHDAYLQKWFQDAAADTAPHPIFLRPMNEMNGAWTFEGNTTAPKLSYGGQPLYYRRAWRRMYNIAEYWFNKSTNANASLNNLIFVWAPEGKPDASGGQSGIADYYPGATYVDWVGASAYATDGQACQASGRCLGDRLTGISRLVSGTKPLMITEGGCSQNIEPPKIACLKDWLPTAEDYGLSAIVYENHCRNWTNGVCTDDVRLNVADPDSTLLYRNDYMSGFSDFIITQ